MLPGEKMNFVWLKKYKILPTFLTKSPELSAFQARIGIPVCEAKWKKYWVEAVPSSKFSNADMNTIAATFKNTHYLTDIRQISL